MISNRETIQGARPVKRTGAEEKSALESIANRVVEGCEGLTWIDNEVILFSEKSANFFGQKNHSECDEGMCFFGESPIPVPKGSCRSTRTATSMYNDAQLQSAIGNYEKAKTMFGLASLQIDSALADNRPPNLCVRIHHGMGYCHYRLGCHEEAMTCFNRALACVKEASLGDIYEAATNNCIAVLLYHGDVPDPSQSLVIFQAILPVYENSFGAQSLKVAAVLGNIGRTYYFMGNYSSALAAHERALLIRRKHSESARPADLAATICNKGRTHHMRGELDEALQCYQDFLKMAAKYLSGSVDCDIVRVSMHMADIYQKRSKLPEALDLYKEALKNAKISFGPLDAVVGSITKSLGDLLLVMNELDLALQCYMQCLEVQQISHGTVHPQVLCTLLNIAQIHHKRGELLTALAFLKDIHARTVEAFGRSSLEAANALSNIGLLSCQLHDHPSAFRSHLEALHIRREHYANDNNLDVASSLNLIGMAAFHQDARELALECFCKSLRIRSNLLGPDHCDVAAVWYNIATLKFEAGDSEQALKFYKECLRVEHLILGAEHQDVLLSFQNIGLIHHQRGELEEALFYLREALTIQKALNSGNNYQYDDEGGSVSNLLNLIGNIHLQTANVGAMMECYVKAARMSTEDLVIGGYLDYVLRRMLPPSAAAA